MALSWISASLDFAAQDFEAGVEHWRAVTGYAVSRRRGERNAFATLVPPDGDDYLRVQCLDDGPSRIHLDLHVDDPKVRELGHRTFTSPAGFAYSLAPHHLGTRPRPPAWPSGRSQVDQVCLDIPADAFDAECDFWQELSGWHPTLTNAPEFRRLDGEGTPLRLLLQRKGDESPIRAHLDLSADDREAETARHLALGATLVRHDRGWNVLLDPAGLEYCVTDRLPTDTVQQ